MRDKKQLMIVDFLGNVNDVEGGNTRIGVLGYHIEHRVSGREDAYTDESFLPFFSGRVWLYFIKGNRDKNRPHYPRKKQKAKTEKMLIGQEGRLRKAKPHKAFGQLLQGK